MLGLGLRLAVSGGREALVRLVVLAVAVGLGAGLLLIAVAGINAVNAQNDRYAWLDTAGSPQSRQSGPGSAGAHHESPPPASASRTPTWLLVTADEFGRQDITRVDLAASGPTSPVPPGIPADPGPGQYYVSPALAALLRATPANELADRYPGKQADVIGEAGLPAPRILLIVIGHAPGQLSGIPGAAKVTAGRGTGPGAADQQPERADRRPAARRRPEGRVPRDQRARPRAVHHHGGGHARHHRERQDPRRLGRLGGLRRPDPGLHPERARPGERAASAAVPVRDRD
jgi:hypothetical protein